MAWRVPGWLGFVVGVGVGAAVIGTWPRTSPPAAAASRPPALEASPAIATAMVCARLRPPAASHPADARAEDADACLAERMQIGILQGQLADLRDDRARVRHAWAEDGPVAETPEAWTQRVEEALEACDLPVELDVVECREYPCIAGVRATGPTDPDPDAAAQTLDTALDGCAAMRDAFAIGDDALDALQMHTIEVPCGDGTRERAFALVALDPTGPAWSTYHDPHHDDGEVLRWMFRRGDDLAAALRCHGESVPSEESDR